MLVHDLKEFLSKQSDNAIVVVRVSEHDVCRTVKVSLEELRFHHNGDIGEVGTYEGDDGDSIRLKAVVLEVDQA